MHVKYNNWAALATIASLSLTTPNYNNWTALAIIASISLTTPHIMVYNQTFERLKEHHLLCFTCRKKHCLISYLSNIHCHPEIHVIFTLYKFPFDYINVYYNEHYARPPFSKYSQSVHHWNDKHKQTNTPLSHSNIRTKFCFVRVYNGIHLLRI